MNMHSSQVQQVLRLVVLALTTQLAAAKLADYISSCSIKDPELNECIMERASIFRPMIVKGLKEFGLPSMNPLHIPLMRIEQGSGGSVGLALNVTDSKHYGWDDMTVLKATADPKNHHFEFLFNNPKYAIIGNYDIKGRILVLPISGSGFSNITIENVNTTIIIDTQLEQRKGESYLKLTKVKCSFTLTKVYIRLDNLFGNKQLSDTMNEFMNENSKDVFKELQPAIEEAFGEIYSLFIGQIFSKIPYSQLFKLE